ncbi:DUF1566 domain-containing protein [Arenicella xantha]|uniref:Lcl C-terminal domain-containing protein n=1 Tax=Arenicella xantha TaxID=644221 RepID=UPI001473CDB1|nr:DUF1566 domain-containing protein [Arenicella xantha]
MKSRSQCTATKCISGILALLLLPTSAEVVAQQQSLPTGAMSLLLLDNEPSAPITSVTYRLPDSGVLIAGNYPTGNNATCSGAVVSQQTCSHGRDVSDYDDSDGRAGFSYTKLDVNGNDLPASAESWACVRDNVTGFVWEVKTDDGGLRDTDNTYFWGGISAEGRGVDGAHGIYYDDWNPLIEAANTEPLCGFDDWRVPHIKELGTLLDRGKPIGPSIDTNYFPNTQTDYYWSSTPGHPENGDDIGRARRFDFDDAVDRSWYRSGQYSHYHVRLVRTDDYQNFDSVK